MTFFEAFNKIKKNHSTNDLVIFEIIFYLSKKVKDKVSYITNRNKQIDFKFKDLSSRCDEYFISNKPLGSITKNTRFLGLDIDVFENILVPRNDTEFVCEIAKEKINEKFKNKNIEIVDLCSGTGNIGLFLKKEFKEAKVTCLDINPVSIKNIKHNANKNKISVNTIEGDYFETLINNKLKFDVIAMNPPYVAKHELDDTMKNYELEISFINSKKPNDFYYNIISKRKNVIKNINDYLMIFEISSTQKSNLEKWLIKNNINFEFYKDLSKKYRVLIISND